VDVNAVVANLLRDMAAIQANKQKTFGYKRAAAAVFDLERPIETMVARDGTLEKIPGLGPATSRIALEVLRTGESPTAARAIAESGKLPVVERARALRSHFLSRSETLRVLSDAGIDAVTRDACRADFQMHSEWSDGAPTLTDLATGAMARGYTHIAVTDHSHGLAIAGGMSPDDVAQQHTDIDRVNRTHGGRFRVIKGVEANIGAEGELDLAAEEIAMFELVLAAPHSKLRKEDDQTARMLRAVQTPGVHVLAHPRGRISGTRAGIVADWDRIFAAAAAADVAVEIDGDPARQDLDYTIAARALAAGCLFALDSDAHAVDQLDYADNAIAHARLAGIPADRVINTWPVDRLLAWAGDRRLPRRRGRRK
jgi:putative hydrolase